MFKRAGPDNIDRARRLRRDATNVERRLWWKLRELNAQGYHFRRQAPFHRYTLDFVEHGARLAIELDGGQHASPKNAAHDAVRDRFLANEGYITLRYWNSDIVENIEGVVDAIVRELKTRPYRPPPGTLRVPTSPQRGR
jgi:very-short-patch-repair endonuclease